MHRSRPAILLFVLCVSACDEPSTPAPTEHANEPALEAQLPAADDERALDAEGPLLEEERFELRLEADEVYRVGEQGAFRVSLRPRGEFEMEARYPYRVAIESGEGVELVRSELARGDAARIDAEEARFDVQFTPRQPGAHRCVVDVEFAVCAENGCFPMERRLAVDLPSS